MAREAAWAERDAIADGDLRLAKAGLRHGRPQRARRLITQSAAGDGGGVDHAFDDGVGEWRHTVDLESFPPMGVDVLSVQRVGHARGERQVGHLHTEACVCAADATQDGEGQSRAQSKPLDTAAAHGGEWEAQARSLLQARSRWRCRLPASGPPE